MRKDGLILPDVFIRTNVDDVIKKLDGVMLQQLPYAMSIALNRTAEQARDERKANPALWGFAWRGSPSGQDLTKWMANHVFIPPQMRASKRMLRVQVRLSPPGSTKRTRYSLMPSLEPGTVLEPTKPIGKGDLFARALIAPKRLTPGEVIPRKWYPAYAGLAPLRDPSGAWIFAGRGAHSRRKVKANVAHLFLRGSDHEFALGTKGKPGVGVILRREGKSLRTLFVILARPVSVPGRPYFTEPVKKSMTGTRVALNLHFALLEAMRTAR